jgi:hypothetical protein
VKDSLPNLIEAAKADTRISNSLFGAICDLPERDAKDLLAALKADLPLNRRLRKLLAKCEDDADNSSGIECRVALDSAEF